MHQGSRRLRTTWHRVPWLKRGLDTLRGRLAGPQQVFSIGVLTGPTPWSLAEPSGTINPTLTARDVVDRCASIVADPFMLSAFSSWWMFFEIMVRPTNKGVIGLATSRDGISWRYERVVLEEPFHLSYPFVFSWHGEYYMIPETSQASAIRLYRAADFPYAWRWERNLITGWPFSDATPFVHDGVWWMMSETDRSGRHDTLRLYGAPDLLGPWSEHPQSPILHGNARGARPAGRIVVTPEGLIRFGQDCTKHYGSAVMPFLVTELSPSRYSEKALGQGPYLRSSGEGWNAGGMHHIDLHETGDGWLASVDGWYYH
jgi:hypothetical protein